MIRDIKIDFIRFIGISLIILAHVSPPNWLFQFRNFDVPLMVVLSGYLYSMKSKKSNQLNLQYIIKRFKRLVIPVWIFLTILFLGILVYQPRILTLKLLITSFGLYSGIGYVWIIRVYLIIALFGESVSNFINKKIFIYLFIYLFYEILCKIEVKNGVRISL
ncbi:MAG: acyltransferase family protein [Bacilli bacterium]